VTPNVAAILATIRHSEGSDRADDPYRVVYGFEITLQNLSDHPAITGEWLGVQTPWGHTSAAGAYQIEKATWIDCKTQLGLHDFTGPSQDDCAILLLKRAGGLALINSGQVTAAIAACRGVWASLPGGSSGQPQKTLASLVDFYTSAGGQLA
jgi:lysozyme